MTPSWPLVLTIHFEWCRFKSSSFCVASYLQKHSFGSTSSQNLAAIIILEALATPKWLSSTCSSVGKRILICFSTSAAGSLVKQEYKSCKVLSLREPMLEVWNTSYLATAFCFEVVKIEGCGLHICWSRLSPSFILVLSGWRPCTDPTSYTAALEKSNWSIWICCLNTFSFAKGVIMSRNH